MMDEYTASYYIISGHTQKHIIGSSRIWYERLKVITLPRALLKPHIPSIFPFPYKGNSTIEGGFPQGSKTPQTATTDTPTRQADTRTGHANTACISVIQGHYQLFIFGAHENGRMFASNPLFLYLCRRSCIVELKLRWQFFMQKNLARVIFICIFANANDQLILN